MRVTKQIFVVYPDADVAPVGYAAFPKSWDAARGPIPSHVLLRRADDTNPRGKSFIVKTRGGDIPWDAKTAPPPSVAVSECLFAEIAGPGEQRTVAVTFQRAGWGLRIKRRLSNWWSTGWVLPTVDFIGDAREPAD
jgi:hypothetical protein